MRRTKKMNKKTERFPKTDWYKKRIKVLDDGFVEYVSHMGDDLTVVNAARVSFAKESEWVYEESGDPPYGNAIKPYAKKLSDRDRKLIDYLAKHNHWTPFAHPQITFRVKAPIFIRTQLFKHKVGIVENEISRRYVTADPQFYTPFWRAAPTDGAKQGSSGFLFDNEKGEQDAIQLDNKYHEFIEQSTTLYKKLIDMGVAPEQARGVLPQSAYTEWWWTGSLSAFSRVCRLRSEEGAQWEVREYAGAFSTILNDLYPYCWKKLT
jgi:thymidylate synthase (FAD)